MSFARPRTEPLVSLLVPMKRAASVRRRVNESATVNVVRENASSI